MRQYTYNGPVIDRYGRCLDLCWTGSTYANSEKKAKSNLSYQYNKNRNMVASSKVTLPGKLVVGQ